QVGGIHPGWRARDGRIAGQRTVPARPGARGFPVIVRRAQNPGADRLHAQDGQAATELTRIPVANRKANAPCPTLSGSAVPASCDRLPGGIKSSLALAMISTG